MMNVVSVNFYAVLADPGFYFSINLYGAPALSLEEFKGFQQDTIIGFTLKVSAPLGTYNDDKLLNIGTNTWSFKPELGISQAIGRWTLEAAAAATIYTDNDDFDSGKTRQRDTMMHSTSPGNIAGAGVFKHRLLYSHLVFDAL